MALFYQRKGCILLVVHSYEDWLHSRLVVFQQYGVPIYTTSVDQGHLAQKECRLS